MMKIAIVGTGYVGLVTGTCLAEVGFDVTCVDIDERKIETLRTGKATIYEPGIDDLLERNISKGRLHFTTSLAEVLDDVTVIFSAVGTPPDEDGSADLQYVLNVAREVGRNMHEYKLVVTKSTVPVGTADKVRKAIQEELEIRNAHIDFDVASNPEFLKEGDAIADFMRPDRIVVGTDSEKAQKLMAAIYKSFIQNGHPVIFTDIASAEMTKYAANAMLATRISFMNDLANLCEKVGADINMIRKGIGSDTRIGSKFLNAGTGILNLDHDPLVSGFGCRRDFYRTALRREFNSIGNDVDNDPAQLLSLTVSRDPGTGIKRLDDGNILVRKLCFEIVNDIVDHVADVEFIHHLRINMRERRCFRHLRYKGPDPVRLLLDEIQVMIVLFGRDRSVRHGGYETVDGRKRSPYVMRDR